MTSLTTAVRKDLREFYDSCDNDGKQIFHQSIELLLEKGHFQRDPYFYPKENIEFVTEQKFLDGFFGYKRPISATELISLSINIKKKILEKTLSIGFSQVTQSEEVREFLQKIQQVSNEEIQSLCQILKDDNLPVPMSWETEVTTSTDSPFSDKLIMYQMGFLLQMSQNYYGAGLASSMRTDLITSYEKIILKGLTITKEWYNIMTKNKWLEQPPLAPNRKELSKEKH
ncbi:hypothetical protein J2S74_002078 [Evansella vedderi]|uniref:DUF3231 family protein n=1 Tax=Evansella vedderi TaxID=38282 RepID=A0ABT9ZTY4_9BACI|nr:hypothetical protein [Evansella vedderi]